MTLRKRECVRAYALCANCEHNMEPMKCKMNSAAIGSRKRLNAIDSERERGATHRLSQKTQILSRRFLVGQINIPRRFYRAKCVRLMDIYEGKIFADLKSIEIF